MDNKYVIDWDEYAKTARQAAADGAVLLKNENDLLPFSDGTRVTVFGRAAFNYYKSGTGSGGLVNTRYVVSILDAIDAEEGLILNTDLKAKYEEWLKDHPFDLGAGWAQEPWSQLEMPLSKEDVQQARELSDTAIVIIGRSAGEDRDTGNDAGSYMLSADEEDILTKVTAEFDRVLVLLNVGNIIDMSWMDRFNVSAVMYVWQGGQEGGNAVCDLLMGRVNPSGRLSDTIAYEIDDYPSSPYFGDDVANAYREDIYVGYRYFETFAKDRVRYPFGYGLSYTTYEVTEAAISHENGILQACAQVKNTGNRAGRQSVLFFVEAPQGKLGKPAKSLIGFAKTGMLAPGEAQMLTIEVKDEVMSSYDDSGVTGHRFAYLLESGQYNIFAGFDVSDAKKIGSFELEEDLVIRECKSALAPVEEFKRMHPKANGDAGFIIDWEDASLRTYDPKERRAEEKLIDYGYSGDKGYKLVDVYDGKVSMGDFLSQLSDLDLRCIVRGEGMNSGRVTPGTGAAYGGVSDGLVNFGIPAGCCSDGPSGIRMDCGTKAFSMPSGTCLACTFDEEINEKLFTFTGAELRKNRIDSLLGPGINIHRHPLNGRNFEYFSEDPLLTGKMAAAQLKGMHKYSVTGTIKHFAANNQEHNRRTLNSVVSERALREIYLKTFEIAVKEGGAYNLMTTYGAINGLWTAGNYDLNTVILREEWGYEGMVMTDWWAAVNSEGEEPSGEHLAQMVASGNDVYMVMPDAIKNEEKDNLKEFMEKGLLSRAQLQRSAANILKVIMRSPVMDRYLGRQSKEELDAIDSLEDEDKEALELTYLQTRDGVVEFDGRDIKTDKGLTYLFGVEISKPGIYKVDLNLSVEASELAQVPITVFANGVMFGSHTLRDTAGESIVITENMGLFYNHHNYIKLFFGQGGITINHIKVYLSEELK